MKLLGFWRPSFVSWVKPVILGGASGRDSQKAIAATTTTKIPTSDIGLRLLPVGLPVSLATDSAALDAPACDAPIALALLSTEATVSGTPDPEDERPESVSRFKRFRSV